MRRDHHNHATPAYYLGRSAATWRAALESGSDIRHNGMPATRRRAGTHES
jgi:hypothetical protein